MGKWTKWVAVGFAGAVAGAPLPAMADPSDFSGDGSYANNSDLLRDTTTGCENCVPADFSRDYDDPWFDLDWSLGLRGSYVKDSAGEHFEWLVSPSVTLSHATIRGGYDFSASADFAHSTTTGQRLAALRAAFGADYRPDALSIITFDADAVLTQDAPGTPGIPNTVLEAPVVMTGTAEVGAERQFGHFIVAGRLNGSRNVFGPTTLTGPVTVDNSWQNNWTTGGGLRVGYEVTPKVTVFVDGSYGYQVYDLPSPTLLTKLDAEDYQLRGGVAADITEVLAVEVSAGVGLRRFADVSLGEVVTQLYDAKLVFRPDETVTVNAGFETNVGAPGPYSGGLARIEYAATADASYQVNTWARLRANGRWYAAQFVGTATTETGWSAGVGADYLFNEFTSLSADYSYARNTTTPNPPEDSQRVTLGVTFHK